MLFENAGTLKQSDRKINVITKSNKFSLFSIHTRELLRAHKKLTKLQALTLVGLTRENRIPDPQAVLYLHIQLFMNGP